MQPVNPGHLDNLAPATLQQPSHPLCLLDWAQLVHDDPIEMITPFYQDLALEFQAWGSLDRWTEYRFPTSYSLFTPPVPT